MADLSGRAVQTDLSRVSYHSWSIPYVYARLSVWLFCQKLSSPSSPVLVALSLLSCSDRPGLYLITWLYYPDLLFWLACPSCPVPLSCTRIAAQIIFSSFSCFYCPVIAVMSWLSCPFCSVGADLSRLICHATLYRLTCPGCPVPFVIPQMPCPSYTVICPATV